MLARASTKPGANVNVTLRPIGLRSAPICSPLAWLQDDDLAAAAAANEAPGLAAERALVFAARRGFIFIYCI